MTGATDTKRYGLFPHGKEASACVERGGGYFWVDGLDRQRLSLPDNVDALLALHELIPMLVMELQADG